MRLLPATAACLSLGLAASWCRPASAQVETREGIALQNQILELRQEVQQLQAGGGGNGAAPPVAPPIGGGGGGASGLDAQLLERVQALEDQNRQMRGELDQLNNQVQGQNAALQKQLGDLSFQMQQGGHPGAGASPAVPGAGGGAPGGASVPVPAAPARHTPETALAAGNAALARHDYPAAQSAAQDVLSGPRNPRQVDAQFLLAQSLAGQHQYQQSAVAYYDAYNRSPRSGRAPDALLGVSASMIALGDKGAACQALAKMHAEFPSPMPRVRAAYSVLHARAACH